MGAQPLREIGCVYGLIYGFFEYLLLFHPWIGVHKKVGKTIMTALCSIPL